MNIVTYFILYLLVIGTPILGYVPTKVDTYLNQTIAQLESKRDVLVKKIDVAKQRLNRVSSNKHAGLVPYNFLKDSSKDSINTFEHLQKNLTNRINDLRKELKNENKSITNEIQEADMIKVLQLKERIAELTDQLEIQQITATILKKQSSTIAPADQNQYIALTQKWGQKHDLLAQQLKNAQAELTQHK